jgi:hypothetical protein
MDSRLFALLARGAPARTRTDSDNQGGLFVIPGLGFLHLVTLDCSVMSFCGWVGGGVMPCVLVVQLPLQLSYLNDSIYERTPFTFAFFIIIALPVIILLRRRLAPSQSLPTKRAIEKEPYKIVLLFLFSI